MRKTLLLLCVFITANMISCKKQEAIMELKVPHASVELSPDELLRLVAMSSNKERSHENVVSAVENYIVSTKGVIGSCAIVDSINGAIYTKNHNSLKLYVVSDDVNKQFAIVNSDINLPPIIGFFEGVYNRDNLNPGFEIMLDYTISQMEYERDSIQSLVNDDLSKTLITKLFGGLQTKKDPDGGAPQIPQWDQSVTVIEREWIEEVSLIQPMLKTNWGQGFPFNTWNAQGHPAGCMAISAAQIMAYWKKPAVSPVNGLHYDWNSMIENIIVNYNANGQPYVSSNNIATESASRLAKDLGSNGYLDITYSAARSGGDCSTTTRTFQKMGYNVGSHAPYTYTRLNSGLATGPVHICADDGGKWIWQGFASHLLFTGHSWVVDGLKQVNHMRKESVKFYYLGAHVYTLDLEPSSFQSGYMHHNNFGWNGSNNGWYYMGADYMPDETCKYNIKLITGINPKN